MQVRVDQQFLAKVFQVHLNSRQLHTAIMRVQDMDLLYQKDVSQVQCMDQP